MQAVLANLAKSGACRQAREWLGLAGIGVVFWLALGFPTSGGRLEGAEAPAAAETTFPVLEAQDLALGEVVKMLARAGRLNVFIDPATVANTNVWSQPTSIRYEQMTARRALEDVLTKHGLAWVWNPETRIGRVTSAEVARAGDAGAGPPREPLPTAAASTNVVAELSETDTPLLEALQGLIRETGLGLLMDPVVAGRVPGADGQPRTWPNVSFQFRNVTALQALAVVLEAHGLALAWNPPLGSGRVTTRERRAWELAHPVAGAASPAALSSLTNTQPLIFIDEAPLEEAARSLSQSLGLNLMFDPSLGSHPPPGGPLMVEGKFRNVTFAQALLGLLENHGLVMLWDPAARLGRVTTWTRAWEEGQRPKNSALPATVGQGTVIPRVQFTQTPLSAVLTALARLAQVNLVLAPELTGETAAGSASALGQTEIDVDWVNVTARQALLAVAANYGLALTWDEAAQKLRVQPPPPGR